MKTVNSNTTPQSLGMRPLFLLLLLLPHVSAQPNRQNFTVFTPAVDLALRQAPSELWDVFAALGLLIGTIFAFVGSKMLYTSSFFFGSFVGAVCGALIVGLIDYDAPSDAFISVVVVFAVLVGLLVAKLVKLARYFGVLAVGIACTAMFNQYVLSHFATDLAQWAIIVVLVVFLLISAFVAWKFVNFSLIFASSILGGFTVLLSTAVLMRSPISPVGMFFDTNQLVECVEMDCWGPFIAGVVVFVLGLSYQLVKLRGKRTPASPKNAEAEREDVLSSSPRRASDLDNAHEQSQREEMGRQMKEMDIKLQILEAKQRKAEQLAVLPMVMAQKEPSPTNRGRTFSNTTADSLDLEEEKQNGAIPLPPNKPKLSLGRAKPQQQPFLDDDAVKTTMAPSKSQHSVLAEEFNPVKDLFMDAANAVNWAFQSVLEALVFGLVLVGRCVRWTYDNLEDAQRPKTVAMHSPRASRQQGVV